MRSLSSAHFRLRLDTSRFLQSRAFFSSHFSRRRLSSAIFTACEDSPFQPLTKRPTPSDLGLAPSPSCISRIFIRTYMTLLGPLQSIDFMSQRSVTVLDTTNS